MNKKSLLALCWLSFSGLFLNAQSYCPASGPGNCDGNWFIEMVRMPGEKGSEIKKFSVCESYADFTAVKANIVSGGAYVVELNLASLASNVGVFIDWNRDGVFTTPDEAYISSASNGVANIPIAAPSGLTAGPIRMRVRATSYIDVPNACDNQRYGEVEDYTLFYYANINDVPQSNPSGGTYCSGSGSPNCAQADGSGTSYPITKVAVIGSNGTQINNSTGCQSYADYSYLSVTMKTDSAYNVAITGGNAFGNTVVYIDWNEDFDFDDPGEAYLESNYNIGADALVTVVTPPASALAGRKRMRVRNYGIGAPSACGTMALGEVEDYSILLLSALFPTPPCASNYNPANNATNVCLNKQVNWAPVSEATAYRFLLFNSSNTILKDTVTDQSNVMLRNLQASTIYKYLVVPRDANNTFAVGCDTIRFTTSANADPVVSILPTSDTVGVCHLDSLALGSQISNGTAPFSYTWLIPAPLTASSSSNPGTSIFAANPGYYKVYTQVSDAGNCRSLDSAVVWVRDLPVLNGLSSDKTNYCPGETASISIQGSNVQGISVLAWDGTDFVNGGANILSSTSFEFQNLSDSILYKVVLSSDFACKDTSDEFILPVYPLPAKPLLTSTAGVLCEGDTVAVSVINYTDNLQWSGTGIASGYTFIVYSSGSVSVTYTDANLCSSQSDPSTFNFNPRPLRPTITLLANRVCQGDTVQLVAGADPSDVLSWNDPNQSISSVLDVFTSGVYTVTASSPLGCTSESLPFELTFAEYPEKPSIESSGTACLGQNIILSSEAQDGDLSWFPGNIQNSLNIAVNQSGAYWCEVKNASSCISVSDTIYLQFNTPPTAPIITVLGDSCEGSSRLLIASSAHLNNWISFGAQDTIEVNQSGQYFCFAQDTITSCLSDTANFNVVFYPIPEQAVISQIADTIFGQTAEQGTEYIWLDENLSEVYRSTINAFAPSKGGNYYLILKSPFGCMSDTSAMYFFSGVGISSAKPVKLVQVYPNPALSEMTLSLAKDAQLLQIYTADGSLLKVIEAQESVKLRLPSGVYYLRVLGLSHAQTVKLSFL